ncbi:cytochrome p450 [Trifolium pratense]|uniref:Cytochrome p450 n=1 Tax=Trifolium pratense TaxID=57577 RepID=A0A2K3P5W7_TRIPR|nr:cytochrome p450 [Trifolium pratense]
MIGNVIFESQSAFVKDRQIFDGILIANEVVDEARKSKKDDVMGDPLSPFLFLLAAEGLNVLMEAMVAQNLFTGYSIGERDPISVTHLQFANDTLLLGVNFNKSMLVEINIPDSWLGEVATALCCKVGKVHFLYLGLSIGGDPRVEGGRLRDGGQQGCSWWREIMCIRNDGGELWGSWFGEHISRRVVDAQITDMWQWQPDLDTGCTVRGAYHLLTSHGSATMDGTNTLI